MSRVLPILFNMKMVRAILDGRKSCTRRIIKPQPQGYFEVSEEPLYIYDTDGKQGKITPPYQPGDILYVRETWKQAPNGYYYYEDWQKDDIADVTKWKPSIHMPKEAARIWLKVTDVRVERLQEITRLSVQKEGIEVDPKECAGKFDFITELFLLFQELWDSTIKKSDLDRYGWDANPYVWVVEFERCEKPKEER
ncbi:hypothetical protein ERE_32570 [Agathobacter rectalis M104/1]|uniref:hypothetical protein n=1 Tax=Agathobacter rectalis TaxID=39491 RepID=UPI0001CD08F6|nr:hypothetical protein [Agathobacter rectalis]CBK95012.1 hypothetical protein ERE_32570 [Agathobacter rectalis M104/1]